MHLIPTCTKSAKCPDSQCGIFFRSEFPLANVIHFPSSVEIHPEHSFPAKWANSSTADKVRSHGIICMCTGINRPTNVLVNTLLSGCLKNDQHGN
ncbi:hypothetical protein FKM82_026713 [Ascaphus truei]